MDIKILQKEYNLRILILSKDNISGTLQLHVPYRNDDNDDNDVVRNERRNLQYILLYKTEDHYQLIRRKIYTNKLFSRITNSPKIKGEQLFQEMHL